MSSSELTLYLLLLMLALSLVFSIRILNGDNTIMSNGNRSMLLSLILTVVCIFWFGGRRIFLGGFVDTSAYALDYINLVPQNVVIKPMQGEWIWEWIMATCKSFDLTPRSFFTVIEAGYLISVLLAIRVFMPKYPYVGILFVYSSLFFLPFGVNGIRNGLACHIMLLAIALLLDSKYFISYLLMFIAFGIHRSTILPIGGAIMSLYVVKDVKFGILLWFLAIPLSLLFGDSFAAFLGSLGFDDRIAQYTLNEDIDESQFSQTGFRWDFLLYSVFPVIMTYYVCVKKQVVDTWYPVICNTYLICNAFWILVITSSFSNRFAYLSWFLYPVVIAYPLVMLPVWHDQDYRTAYILLAYLAFTFIMNIFWHSF